MWIAIAIAMAAVLAAGVVVWRRKPRVADDMRRWQHGMAALGRTAERPAAEVPPPRPPEPDDLGQTVRVLGRPTTDDEA